MTSRDLEIISAESYSREPKNSFSNSEFPILVLLHVLAVELRDNALFCMNLELEESALLFLRFELFADFRQN